MAKKKAKGGRPKMASDEKRAVHLHIRIKEQSRDTIRQKATDAGKTVTEFVEEKCLR